MSKQPSFTAKMAGMRAKHAFQWWSNITAPGYQVRHSKSPGAGHDEQICGGFARRVIRRGS